MQPAPLPASMQPLAGTEKNRDENDQRGGQDEAGKHHGKSMQPERRTRGKGKRRREEQHLYSFDGPIRERQGYQGRPCRGEGVANRVQVGGMSQSGDAYMSITE